MKAQKQIYSGDRVKIIAEWYTDKRKKGTVIYADAKNVIVELTEVFSETFELSEVQKIGK